MEFSLFHHTAPPKGGLNKKTPLLLLLHGYGANEDDLFSLSPYLDERFLVISARAPVTLGPMSYAWFNLGGSPEGLIINPGEIETALQTLRRFIGEIVDYYQVDRNAVYLAGFSQCARMSLAVALGFPGAARELVVVSGRRFQQHIATKDALSALPT